MLGIWGVILRIFYYCVFTMLLKVLGSSPLLVQLCAYF